MELITDFFLVGGILVTILIISLLRRSKKRALPQIILIVFFGLILLLMMNMYADLHELELLYIITFPFADTTVWMVGPLLFLYVKSLFHSGKGLVKSHLVHFTPLVIFFLGCTAPMLSTVFIEGSYFDYLKYIYDGASTFFIIESAYLSFYLLLSLRLFTTYKKTAQGIEHAMSDTDIDWVRYLLIGALLVISIDFAVAMLEYVTGVFNSSLSYASAIALALDIGYLGYHGINQSRVLVPESFIEIKPQEKEKKHHLSATCEQGLIQLKKDFERIMTHQKPYLDEELTLHKLAQYIPTTDKKLSALLNQYMDTTFYDCINRYRVAAVKEKINTCECNNLTLLGIAYECGFNSKTSFNRIFKKETGLSPSEYRKATLVLEYSQK